MSPGVYGARFGLQHFCSPSWLTPSLTGTLSFPSLGYCCMFSPIPESVIKLSEKRMLGKVHFTQHMHYQVVRGPPFRTVSVLKS